MLASKHRRRGDHQLTLWFLIFARRLAFGVFHLLKDPPGGGNIIDPGVGERQFAGGSRQQAYAQRALSSSPIWRLTVVNGIFSARAAADMLPSSVTFTSSAIALNRSIILPFCGKMIATLPVLSFFTVQSMMAPDNRRRYGSNLS